MFLLSLVKLVVTFSINFAAARVGGRSDGTHALLKHTIIQLHIF